MPEQIDLANIDAAQIERLTALADALRDVARCAAAFAASLERLRSIQVETPATPPVDRETR
jgi:hypothetical protein